jgi:hypothetical protein
MSLLRREKDIIKMDNDEIVLKVLIQGSVDCDKLLRSVIVP